MPHEEEEEEVEEEEMVVVTCKGNVMDISVLVFCTVHCAFDRGAKKLIILQTFYIYILITVL